VELQRFPIDLYICLHLRTYIHIYVHIFIYIYTYIYIHIHHIYIEGAHRGAAAVSDRPPSA